MHVFVVNTMAFVTNLFCCQQQQEYSGDSITSITTVYSSSAK